VWTRRGRWMQPASSARGSRTWGIQPGSRPRANTTVNLSAGIPMAGGHPESGAREWPDHLASFPLRAASGETPPGPPGLRGDLLLSPSASRPDPAATVARIHSTIHPPAGRQGPVANR